jgi:molybdate transport system regulatory protein
VRKTSARNRFFGKVTTVEHGDIQSLVRLVTPAGHALTAVITNDSVDRLGLTAGRLLTAEVKAPWVVLERSDGQPASSAENQFHGAITSIRRGRVSSEIAVRIDENTELCAIVSTAGWRQLGLKEHDPVRVLFNCFAVILHAD